MPKKRSMDQDGAEALALTALSFLAADAKRLGRFLALTGLEAQDLRADAGTVTTLSAVLGHLLQDEPLLLVFSANAGIDPLDVARASEVLAAIG